MQTQMGIAIPAVPNVCQCGASTTWFTTYGSGHVKRHFKCGRFIDTMRQMDTGCERKWVATVQSKSEVSMVTHDNSRTNFECRGNGCDTRELHHDAANQAGNCDGA